MTLTQEVGMIFGLCISAIVLTIGRVKQSLREYVDLDDPVSEKIVNTIILKGVEEMIDTLKGLSRETT